jgi:hypothetical protein
MTKYMTRAGVVCAAYLLVSSCYQASRFGDPNATAAFRGYISCGFEASSFAPCGTSKAYWIDCDDPPWTNAVSILDTCDVRRCSVHGVYVELDAALSPLGSYGHLGNWQHELTPHHVYYVHSVGPNTCTWTRPADW